MISVICCVDDDTEGAVGVGEITVSDIQPTETTVQQPRSHSDQPQSEQQQSDVTASAESALHNQQVGMSHVSVHVIISSVTIVSQRDDFHH